MTARRLLVLATATLLVGAAAPAGAVIVAGPYDVATGGCTRDAVGPPLDPLCAPAVPGLASPVALAAAGRRLFVAASGDGAVTALTRDPASGLAQRGASPRSRDCVAATAGTCAQTVKGLSGVDALAVSRDGADVYAGSTADHAVVGLDTATLAPIAGACVTRLQRHLCAGVRTLRSVGGLALSPDGHQLYVASFGSAAGDDALITLARDPVTGALAADPAAPCVQSIGGASVCPLRASGLEGVTALAATADGRFVYAASPTSSAVVGLRRNRATGRLTPLPRSRGCVHDAGTRASGNTGCVAVAALRGARDLVLSSSGATLYVISSDPGSIQALRRNPATGALSAEPGGCMSAGTAFGCSTFAALRGAASAVLTDHGRQLVVAALGADAVVALSVDRASGLLSAPVDPGRDQGTLTGPVALAAGADTPAVYVASSLDDSVATLLPTSVR